jgi:hypothetical protein
MKEERYASRIRQALNHGLKDISPASCRRLEAARHLALSRQKQTAPVLVLAGGNAHGNSGHFFGDHGGFRYSKQLMAIAALLVGMWLSFYWHSVQYINEIEEVDSALLADDLPPEAFFDNDIFEWLKADDSSAD